jgi:DNA invertase Pin-like site-specific DNA recombinase
MTEYSKITPSHLARLAVVYIRQSTNAQVESNRESTARQYDLQAFAAQLGWPLAHIRVIDQDLGISGSGLRERSGFAALAAEVALGQVGIVLALEVSRLARNNADWYRLLDLCGTTDTLIGDADGLYHPGLFNDRLVLGLKGTMSEAELHVLRARLNGGIRNKAARGELRRGLPIGLVWGEHDGEVRFHPDAAVTGAIGAVFARFREMGSARRVWLWFRSEALPFPTQAPGCSAIQWGTPTYTKIHQILTNPVYAGAYVYGKTRQEHFINEHGEVRKRLKRLRPADWGVLIRDHHEGFIDWATFEANRVRLAANTRPMRHDGTGALREGAALLQGLALCGHCGRKLLIAYSGRHAAPSYYCPGDNLANGRGEACLRIGGQRIQEAVTAAVLAAVQPAALQAALDAAETFDSAEEAALAQWQHQLEQARYQAQLAQRRYQNVDPDNRLVARGLEAAWEEALQAVRTTEQQLQRHRQQQPHALSRAERDALLGLAEDLPTVWSAASTTDRDRKELLRAVLEEVMVTRHSEAHEVRLTLRWNGGLLSDIAVALPRVRPATVRTDEDTVALIRRLAVHYPDAVIAGVLNRQQRTTVTGLPFTVNRVSSLRTHWGIPCFVPPAEPVSGEPATIREAAAVLGVAPSTLHRQLNDGLIAGEQTTPGAPWRILITDALRARFAGESPEGYVPIVDAMRLLGVSRQTVLQRVKRGELDSIHVSQGNRKGLRIKVHNLIPDLFDDMESARG